MDSFSILGLTREASPAEIKRAYRRLAMTWHPDRSSHPEASERFKQIRAAYEALRHRVHLHEPEPGASAAAEPPRAADIRLDMEISLEEAAFGCAKTIQVTRSTTCATCSGTGEAGISHSRPCPSCSGSGRVRRRHQHLERCSQCNGQGFLRQRTCAGCGGHGQQRSEVSLEVRVPAGMSPEGELRLAGQGERGSGNLASGDLFLKLSLSPHPLFQMQGRNLSYDMPVNALLLLAGGRIEVPGLAGREFIELVAGDGQERTERLPGKGFPGRRHGQAGDLIIRFVPIMPRHFTAEQASLLQAAAAACEASLEKSLPEIAAWRRRHGV